MIYVAVCALRAERWWQRVHVFLYETGGVAGGTRHDAPERREAEHALGRHVRDVLFVGGCGGVFFFGGEFALDDDFFGNGEAYFFGGHGSLRSSTKGAR